MVMVMAMVMERGKLKPLLLLKPMLNQVIIIMAMHMVDMATDTVMERGKPMLPLATIIMVMVMMVMDMDMDMDMERGKPPSAIIIMVMVDMVMDMVMDTKVKQYLFISFSKFCCIHWNLL